MDLVLIYPPVTVKERYARKVGKTVGGNLPPLGIAGLAAFVREKGYLVDVVDSLSLGFQNEDIVRKVGMLRPKVVGFSALTVNYHRALACAQHVRTAFHDILVILGGHHATITPREIVRNADCFDLVVIGEGELTLLDILQKYKSLDFQRARLLENPDLLSSINGIAYRGGQGVVVNKKRELIEDLDSLPFPARDLLPMRNYIPLPNQYLRLPVVHMTAIRGCPFSCSFCSNNAVFGRKIRAKSPQRVVDEIEHVMSVYGAREISFWDDTMTINRKWMEGFCDEMTGRAINVTWTGYARVDTVDLPLLKKMKAAGCWNLFYGFEAGDQKLLDNISKGITLEQIRQANRWTKESGIEVRGSFMLALPGETPALARKTIDFAKELSPDYAQFSLTTPYPGTPLWEEAEKYGALYKDFRDYHGWSPVFVPYGYKSKDEILEIEKKAVREFYLRPAFVFNCIRKIRSFEDIKRYLKGLRFLIGFV